MKRFLSLCTTILLLAATGASTIAGGSSHHHHALDAPAPPHGGILQSVGQHRIELTYDDRTGQLALYVLTPAGDPHAVAAEPLQVRIEPSDPAGLDDPLDVELFPIAQKGDPAGQASRFVGGDPGLIAHPGFRATPRIAIGGRVRETTFTVRAGTFRPRFACPMDCEGKAYAQAGRCPVCRMKLQPAERAHADHSPKHGGTLFMASNGWHHLEGVLSPDGEFQLYLYNDFTKPIPAAPFEDRAWIEVPAADAEGERRRLPLNAAGNGDFLRTLIDPASNVPLDVVLYLHFEGRQKPDRFDFRFD